MKCNSKVGRMENPNHKFIFDFGANSGQNLDYYLSRADVVVAVEANPKLCAELSDIYAEEISLGRLYVENCVLTDQESDAGQEVDFFIHKQFSVFSRLEVAEDVDQYSKVQVLSSTPSGLIRKYLPRGSEPYFVKVDVEGYDARILQELFSNQVYPEFISAEAYTIETLAALINSGVYPSFNMVEGNSVHQLSWTSSTGLKTNFPHHSAGPFGLDIETDWYDSNTFFQFVAYEKLGWKDIHASKIARNNVTSLGTSYLLRMDITNLFLRIYRTVLPKGLRKHISKFIYQLKKLFA